MKLALCLALCALTACEKPRTTPLGAEDLALLRDLPGGNAALIGGDASKVQDLLETTTGKLAQGTIGSATSDSAAYKRWSDCLIAAAHHIAGTVVFASPPEIRFVYEGKSVKDIATCASSAGYAATVDPDGKFVAVHVIARGGEDLQAGYLQLADGHLFTAMPLKPIAAMPPLTRAYLEDITKKTAQSTAADDKHLVELAGKADRSRTFWFAAAGANTPLATKVSDIYGTVDIAGGGVGLDAHVTVIDGRLATQIEASLDASRKQAASLPPAMKTVLDALKLQRDGSTFHVTAHLTADQISMLTRLAGSR